MPRPTSRYFVPVTKKLIQARKNENIYVDVDFKKALRAKILAGDISSSVVKSDLAMVNEEKRFEMAKEGATVSAVSEVSKVAMVGSVGELPKVGKDVLANAVVSDNDVVVSKDVSSTVVARPEVDKVALLDKMMVADVVLEDDLADLPDVMSAREVVKTSEASDFAGVGVSDVVKRVDEASDEVFVTKSVSANVVEKAAIDVARGDVSKAVGEVSGLSGKKADDVMKGNKVPAFDSDKAEGDGEGFYHVLRRLMAPLSLGFVFVAVIVVATQTLKGPIDLGSKVVSTDNSIIGESQVSDSQVASGNGSIVGAGNSSEVTALSATSDTVSGNGSSGSSQEGGSLKTFPGRLVMPNVETNDVSEGAGSVSSGNGANGEVSVKSLKSVESSSNAKVVPSSNVNGGVTNGDSVKNSLMLDQSSLKSISNFESSFSGGTSGTTIKNSVDNANKNSKSSSSSKNSSNESVTNYGGGSSNKSSGSNSSGGGSANDGATPVLLTPDHNNELVMPASESVNVPAAEMSTYSMKRSLVEPIAPLSSYPRSVRFNVNLSDVQVGEMESVVFPSLVVSGKEIDNVSLSKNSDGLVVVDLVYSDGKKVTKFYKWNSSTKKWDGARYVQKQVFDNSLEYTLDLNYTKSND